MTREDERDKTGRRNKKQKELVSGLQKPKARADPMVPSDTRGL